MKLAWFDKSSRIVERDVFETVRRNDMQVHVGYLEASDDECCPLTSECPYLGVADAVGEVEQVVCSFHREVRPSVDFESRDDEDVPLVDRVDRHDRNRQVVAVHEGSG